MIRTFIAVELPGELKKAMVRAQDQVKSRIRQDAPSDARIQWARAESIHLTLKFLGDIEEAQVEPIRQALVSRVAAFPRFSVEVRGLGVFPDLRLPHVLWIGLSDQPGRTQGLVQLAEQVEIALESLGFVREARPFSPHLTLARIKERARDVGKILSASGALTQEVDLGSLPVEAVALMKSDLKPSGAVYTRLWEVPLARNDG